VEVELCFERPVRETTSAVSAAFWYPFSVGPEAAVEVWSRDALNDFRRIEALDEAHGVSNQRVVELFPESVGAPGWREMLSDLRRARPEELRSGRRDGWVFSAPVVDTSLYLPWLETRARNAGVHFEARRIDDLHQALERSSVVINCSGLGARELAADPRVYPVRGELVRTAPLEATNETSFGVWLDEHANALRYIVPRSSDTILGGTYEPEREDTKLDPSRIEEIVQGCAEMVPELRELERLEHRVGFRPGRDEVRLELEHRDDGRIVHNYGHGGAGVTLSWGCARAVLALLEVEPIRLPWDFG
jgi:D-amino-acid oxidase